MRIAAPAPAPATPSPVSLASLDATALRDLLRAGELGVEETVRRHMDAIAAWHPAVNAMIGPRFEAALADARRLDRARADAHAMPLFGLPFTVKESISALALPHTLGSLARRDRVGGAQAVVVDRLVRAGGIFLGVSNVPEMVFWSETANHVFGRTSNPYDARRTAGGSSGGEAALVATGGAAFGIGSDIGGSIRIPAAFCGVHGHKPSPGFIPYTGHWPNYGGAGAFTPMRYSELGPITRSVRDLALLLPVMSGPDGHDPGVAESFPTALPAIDPRRLRVHVLDEPGIAWARRPSPAMTAAVHRAANALASQGATLVPCPAGLLRDAVDAWTAAFQGIDGFDLEKEATGGARLDLAAEWVRQLVRRPRHTVPVLLQIINARYLYPSWRRRAAAARLARLAERCASLLGPHDVLLLPAQPGHAPKHGHQVLSPYDFAYTGVFNALRLPVTCVPAGLSPQGLPLGVQVVAAAGGDYVALAAADAVSGALGRPAPPTLPSASPPPGAPPAYPLEFAR